MEIPAHTERQYQDDPQVFSPKKYVQSDTLSLSKHDLEEKLALLPNHRKAQLGTGLPNDCTRGQIIVKLKSSCQIQNLSVSSTSQIQSSRGRFNDLLQTAIYLYDLLAVPATALCKGSEWDQMRSSIGSYRIFWKKVPRHAYVHAVHPSLWKLV